MLVADLHSKSKTNATQKLGSGCFRLAEVSSWLDAIETMRLTLMGEDESSSDDEELQELIWLPFKATDKERIVSKPTSTKTISKTILKAVTSNWTPKAGKTYDIIVVQNDRASHSGTAKGGSATSSKALLTTAMISSASKAYSYVITHDTLPAATAGIWSVLKFQKTLDNSQKKEAINAAYSIAASKVKMPTGVNVTVQSCVKK